MSGKQRYLSTLSHGFARLNPPVFFGFAIFLSSGGLEVYCSHRQTEKRNVVDAVLAVPAVRSTLYDELVNDRNGELAELFRLQEICNSPSTPG